MITFYTFGDSHASEHGRWDKIHIDNLKININHFGAKTMSFFIIKDILPLLSSVNNGDIVCFCYGEIDCRVHINKFEPDYKQAIDNMTKRYFDQINELRNVYKKLKISIFNVVPPVARERDENKHMEINSLPTAGTDEDRKKYTLYTNEKLKEYCNNLNYIFFDVYDKYVDIDGYINPKLSDGNCHIGNPIYLEEFIKNNLL